MDEVEDTLLRNVWSGCVLLGFVSSKESMHK